MVQALCQSSLGRAERGDPVRGGRHHLHAAQRKFHRLVPSILIFVFYAISFVFNTLVTRTLGLSVVLRGVVRRRHRADRVDRLPLLQGAGHRAQDGVGGLES